MSGAEPTKLIDHPRRSGAAVTPDGAEKGAAAGRDRARTPEEREARGRAERSKVGRSQHADWDPVSRPNNPVELLEAQAASRVPELLPIRYGRMLESPFAFFRGAAAVMAADLSTTPSSGLRVQLCGDAHLSNFGGFATPERSLVFDLNDFDETLPGPFEWDLKRLAASVEIAARERGFAGDERRAAVLATVGEYRLAMRRFAGMRELEVWYTRMAEAELLAAVGAQTTRKERARVRKSAAKARSKDRLRAFSKLTERVDGSLRIASDPPLIVPVEEIVQGERAAQLADEMRGLIGAYCRTLSGAARRLMESYHYVHMARKVVGVGSVGTRAWIILLVGRDESDPLFLQVKEAQQSVLEPFAGRSHFTNEGRRVVEGQWLMQAASDIFLGWVRATGVDDRTRDFYVRQLWDWKRSAEVETMTPRLLAGYGRMCGWTLARAHARSGDSIAISAYLGRGQKLDRALSGFAVAYADQNERDYASVAAAAESGRIEASAGV
jgi:uncharacterized protein (DUF2252 family)